MAGTATDIALIGGGIMSATLATLIHEIEPAWTIDILEAGSEVATESSSPWHNAGTGHEGMCELDYALPRAGGGLDISKAVAVSDQFSYSRQLWAHLVTTGRIREPAAFIAPVPHMAFVTGQSNSEFVRAWHEALTSHPRFSTQEFSTSHHKIRSWAPLLIEGRPSNEPVAATYAREGTEVNYGMLARLMFQALTADGARLRMGEQVESLWRDGGVWRIRHRNNRRGTTTNARFVFVGAGGGSLALLQGARMPQVAGYCGLPVSGKFLWTKREDLASAHRVKAYTKARIGVPSVGAAHLDHRTIDGARALLFGPFAGLTAKFLKSGSWLDFPRVLNRSNIIPLAQACWDNRSLVNYLASEVTASHRRNVDQLRALMPTATDQDWQMVQAGQRVQILKPGPGGRGMLQFGTEVVVSAQERIAGLLGASPGASTAAALMSDVILQAFPERAGEYRRRLATVMPALAAHSAGRQGGDRSEAELRRHTSHVLGLPF